jgi:hypothetical protein
MKLLSPEIFWDYVAAPYLSVNDFSNFEHACCNHEARSHLLLPEITVEGTSIDEEIDDNPYEGLILSYNFPVKLSSEEMLRWCEKRHLHLPNIRLGYDPTPDTHKQQEGFKLFRICFPSGPADVLDASKPTEASAAARDWDLFNFVEILYIDVDLPLISQEYLIPRLHSIKSFGADYNVALWKDSTMLNLMHKCIINEKRDVRVDGDIVADDFPSSPLTSLLLNLDQLPLTALDRMVLELPSIESISLEHASKLNDNIVKNMAKCWKKLNSLSVYGGLDFKWRWDGGSLSPRKVPVDACNITDSGLEAFRNTKHRFKQIVLYSCPYITAMGLSMLMLQSTKTLMELVLGRMNSIERENDLSMVLTLCPRLKTLALIDLPIYFSDNMLKMVAAACPMIRSLSLRSDSSHHSTFTDTGIADLTSGCTSIESLHLGWSKKITPAGFQAIAMSYQNTLKSFAVFGSSVDKAWFDACHYKVKVLQWSSSPTTP